MAVLQIDFKFLGLMVPKRSGTLDDGARVLLPAHRHRAEFRCGGEIHALKKGAAVRFLVDGTPLSGPVAVIDHTSRIAALDRLFPKGLKLKDPDSLRDVINADIELAGGRIESRNAEVVRAEFQDFVNESWLFKDSRGNVIHQQQLTNQVVFFAELPSNASVAVEVDGHTTTLRSEPNGDVMVVIESLDSDLGPKPWEGKEMDFGYAYACFDIDQGTHLPVPQATGQIVAPQQGWSGPICPFILLVLLL